MRSQIDNADFKIPSSTLRKGLTILIFSVLSFSLSAQQYMNRGQFALFLFNNVYPSGAVPQDYVASYYPVPFLDGDQASLYQPFMKIFSYLEYGDGVSVFDRETTAYKYNELVSRADVIKMIIEAYNVPINTSVGLPYNDYTVGSSFSDQIQTAYNLGVLPNGNQLDPWGAATVSFATNLMQDIENYYPPSNSQLQNPSNYFIPFNLTINNSGQFQQIEQGGFSHYAKNSFNIPDIKFGLDFAHFYSNMMVEMPSDYYVLKPLSRGWSHTYNSYVEYHENTGPNSVDYFTVVWPDGTIDVFNEDDNGYETEGVYDDFDEISSSEVRIKKKDGTRYYYKRYYSGYGIYYLERIRDRNNNEINIEYEPAEAPNKFRIESVEAPSGKELHFDYLNNHDLLIRVTDPIGRDIEFDYSGTGNWVYDYPILKEFYDAKNQLTRYYYQNNNPYDKYLLDEIKLPKGNSIHADYSGNGKLSEYQINNDDPTTVQINFNYQNTNYHTTVHVPVEGGNINTMNYSFNDLGNITDFADNNNALHMSYPSVGVNVMLPSNSDMNGVHVEYDYDSRGNVKEINREYGLLVDEFDWNTDNTLDYYTDNNGNVTHFYYDNDGNLTSVMDALNNWSYFTYDNHGQLKTSTNQEGIQVVYSYEDDGVVDTIFMEEGIIKTFQYDGVNRLLFKNDNGLVTGYLYDDNDNLTSETNPMGFTTTFDYDENDNLIEIVNAQNVATTFEYDDQDRLIKETYGNLITQYNYSTEGFLEQFVKPSYTFINYDYDNHGRLNKTGTITDIDYNSRNLIEEISTNTGTSYLEYDELNRLEKVISVHGNETRYTYDDVGNVKKIYYPDVNGQSFRVLYSYDEKNRMTHVGIDNNGQYSLIAEYQYRDDDLLEEVNYLNDLRTLFYYDDAGRKEAIVHSWQSSPNTGTVVFSENVDLDNRNNVISENHYYREEEYLDFAYIPTAESKTYSYDDNNHLQNISSYPNTVDDDGNTVQRQCEYYSPSGYYSTNHTIQYNVDDMVTEINVNGTSSVLPTTFEYNGYGLQTSKSTPNPNGGTYDQYFSRDLLTGNTILETNNWGNDAIYRIYGATGLELTIDHNGEFIYHLGDLKGSVVLEVGNNFHIDSLRFFHYDDFGKEVFKPVGVSSSYPGGSNVGVGSNQYRYLGKHGIVKELGTPFYNVKARYYDPETGRFLSEDPIWSTNLYPYSDNNPISKSDPSGRIPLETFADAASIGLSASDLYNDPSWANAGYLVWDALAVLIPYVPGSYIAKGVNHLNKSGATGANFFASTKRAFKHWTNHSSEFTDLNNATEYVRAARNFLNNSPAGTLVKRRASDGATLKYNEKLNLFGIIGKDGYIKTFFKPSAGINYWLRQ